MLIALAHASSYIHVFINSSTELKLAKPHICANLLANEGCKI